MRLSARLTLSLAALAIVSLALAAVTPQQVALRIKNRIPAKWKCTNLCVKVVPTKSAADTQRGHYQSITVTATSALIDGIRVTGMKLESQDPTLSLTDLVSKNRITLLKARTRYLSAKLYEKDMNQALTRKDTPIKDLQVKLGDGILTFTGKYNVGIGTNLKLEGRLETPDHYVVNFVPTKAWVGSIQLPIGPLKKVLSKINPLMDFKKVPMSPHVGKVIIQPGVLVICQ